MNRLKLSRIMSSIAALWLILAAFARIAINIGRGYALDPLPFASIIIGIVLIITVLPTRSLADGRVEKQSEENLTSKGN